MEGKTEFDPTGALRSALKSAKAKHHAAITDPAAIGGLMRAIDAFADEFVTLCALKFSAPVS